MSVSAPQGHVSNPNLYSDSHLRIDYPLASSRGVRVIALDSDAEKIVSQVLGLEWQTAKFYHAETAWDKTSLEGGPAEITLTELGTNKTSQLSETLDQVDSTIMIATSDSGTEAAATIAAACDVRGITSAGLVFGKDIQSTVSALRPYARVLLISSDENDLESILTAMRA